MAWLGSAPIVMCVGSWYWYTGGDTALLGCVVSKRHRLVGGNESLGVVLEA